VAHQVKLLEFADMTSAGVSQGFFFVGQMTCSGIFFKPWDQAFGGPLGGAAKLIGKGLANQLGRSWWKTPPGNP